MANLTLSGPRKQRIQQLLRFVNEADRALQPRREKVQTWLERFEAQSPFSKNFPFVGASSVHVPMVAIAQNAIKARVMSSVFDQDQSYNAEPFDEGPVTGRGGEAIPTEDGKPMTWRDVSESVQEYIAFEISSSGEVPFRDFADDIIEDETVIGTAFPTCSWEDDLGYRVLADGRVIPYKRRSQIKLSVPEFDRLIFPFGYPDLERIPYVTEKYTLRPSEMLSRILSIGWNETAVKQFLKEHGKPEELSYFDQVRDRVEGAETETMYQAKEVWLGETWARLDWSGDGKEVPVVIDHSVTGGEETIFRVMPWPYHHGRSKFICPTRYIRRKNRLLGMGLCERGEHLDEAISTVINQIIDMGTRANTAMWGVDEEVVGVQELMGQTPGTVVPRGDDPNAISEIRMSGTQPDLFEGFNILLMLFEKLIGVSDYDLGRESQQVGGDGTATATLALLKQSHLNMSLVVDGLHQTLNRVGWYWLQLLAQQKPTDRVAQVLGPKRARNMFIALSLAPDQLEKRIALSVAFSKDAATQELQRQQEMAKWGLYEQFTRGMMEMAMRYLEVPHLAGYIHAAAKDAHLRMRKLMESYGDSYSSKTLPSLADYLQSIPPGALLAAQMGQEGGDPNAQQQPQ